MEKFNGIQIIKHGNGSYFSPMHGLKTQKRSLNKRFNFKLYNIEMITNAVSSHSSTKLTNYLTCEVFVQLQRESVRKPQMLSTRIIRKWEIFVKQ